MKLKQARNKDFKRFTDLTVKDIPSTARLVMLAGPNGSGKSSFFDALATWHRNAWRQMALWDPSYHRKTQKNERDRWNSNDVQVEFYEPIPEEFGERKKAFYFRTAHRNEPEFTVNQLSRSGEILDQTRVNRMIDNDIAVSQNYQRLASSAFSDAFERAPGDLTLKEFRENTIGVIRDAFQRVFPEVELNSLGDPLTNGTFRFTKGVSSGFLFKNLSGGEKAVFDLILDLVVAKQSYNNTVFCIDEPETHLNSRLQAKLLSELYALVPENCQLVLATHSIGMMRRAEEISKKSQGSVCFLDFDGRNFDQIQIIEPISPTRSFWLRTYAVALDDLSALVAPRRVIICEGTPKTPKAAKNESNDARCYDAIFQAEYPDTRFVSGGNVGEVLNDRFLLSESLSSLIEGIEIVKLIDRDDRSEAEITELCIQGTKVLSKRNLESYLFDDEVIEALSKKEGKTDKIQDILSQKATLLANSKGASDDLKQIRGQLYITCKNLLELTQCGNTVEAFMRDTLAPAINTKMKIYSILREDIFGNNINQNS